MDSKISNSISQLANRVVLLLALSLLLAAAVSHVSLSRINDEYRQQTVDFLTDKLLAVHSYVKDTWLTSQFNQLQQISGDPTLAMLVESHLARDDKASSRASLTRYLSRQITQRAYSFYLVDNDFVNIVTNLRTDVNKTHVASQRYQTALDNLLAGERAFIPAIKYTDNNLTNTPPALREKALFFIGLPIVNRQNKVIASILLGFEPEHEISQIMRHMRTGSSDETYMIDRYGRLLTESRYEHQLKLSGRLKDYQSSILNISVKVPDTISEYNEKDESGNQRYTKMAQAIMAQKSGSSVQPYYDYRGARVIGSWLWDKELQMGIATEIDEREFTAKQQEITQYMLWQSLSTAALIGLLVICSLVLSKRVLDRLLAYISELRATIDHAPNPLVSFSASGRLLDYNLAAQQLFGFTDEQIKRYYFSQLFPSIELARTDFSNGAIEFDAVQAVTNSGKQVEVKLLLNRYINGRKKVISASIEDLTNKHALEARLLQLESAVQQSQAAVLIANIDGDIEYANEAFCQLHDFTPETATEKNIIELKFSEKSNQEKALLLENIHRGEQWRGEYEYAHNGAMRWESAMISPIKNRDGENNHFLVIIEDISDNLCLAKSPYCSTDEQTKETPDNKPLLVVEDNISNQEVLVHQLGMLGYQTHVASHGEQALQKVEQYQYGLILLDCHMPIMDGYTFAHVFRELELQRNLVRTPIIAVTADSGADEVAKCLDAGMDDFLSKPVMLEELEAHLTKWLSTASIKNSLNSAKILPQTATPPAELLSDTASSAQRDAIDISALDKFLGKDKTIQKQFVKSYQAQSEMILHDVLQAITADDLERTRQQSHKLKSSSRTVGANVLANICQQLEDHCKADDLSGAKASVELLEQEFNRVNQFIKNF